MKKILCLLLALTFLTGCEATYNLKITNDTYTEDIDLYVKDSDKDLTNENYRLSFKELFDLETTNFHPVYYNDYRVDPYAEEKQDNVEYYNQKSLITNDRYGMNYSYTFDAPKFIDSAAVNTCYNEITLKKNEDIYTIETNKLAKCFNNYSNLDKLTINITINHRVIYNNADEVNGSTYTWIITEDNYQNKPIKFLYTKEKTNLEYSGEQINTPDTENPPTPSEEESPQAEEKQNPLLTYLIVGGVVIIFLGGIIILIKYKSHK